MQFLKSTFVSIVALACTAHAQLPAFTQSFNPNTSKISMLPLQSWGIFHQSETINLQTSDGSSVRVFNLRGTTVYQGPPGALPSLPVDHYFVECPGDRSQFCVLPDDYQGASFLGTESANGTDSAYIQRLDRIQPTWIRSLTDGQWPVVEPSPGVWSWASLDKAIAANPGRKIIVAAFIRPEWLTDNSQFLPRFLTYVTALAQRYDGKIYAIEIWNEPWVETVAAYGAAWGDIGNPVTGDMSVDLPVWKQTLATMIAASKQAVRSVSSTIKVFGPDWQSLDYANYVEEFVGLAGEQALDAYTFHSNTFFPTTCLIAGPNGTNELSDLITPYLGTTPWMMTEFHPFGASALGIPRAGADPGIPGSGINWQRGMNRMIQSVIMLRADGAEAIIPHVMLLSGSSSGANWEVFGWEWGASATSPESRGPHPKTSAYMMTGYWLNGATFVDARTPGQKVFLYAWKRPDNSSLVCAWTAEGQTAPLQSSFAVTDIFGQTNQINALTENPVLFTSTTLNPSDLMNNILLALTQNYSVPPVWKRPINNQSIRAGQTLQFTVSAAFDPNRSPITYSISPMPAGASLNPTTGEFTWTPTGAQIGSYPVTVTATDDQGKSAATSTAIDVVGDLLDRLANYWKFDEGSGTTVADSVGAANGTLTTTSGWTNGVDGGGLSFNGAASVVVLPSAALNFTNNFTLAAWLYPRSAVAAGAFVSVRCGYQASGFRFFILGNSLNVQGQTTAGWKGASFGDGSIQSSNWYHVAVVYDKSTVKAYINGLYQGGVAWGGDLVMNTNAYSVIGAQSGYYFNGIVDDLMIFNRTLSGPEISELYLTIPFRPRVTALTFAGNNVQLQFTTASNQLYRVEVTSTLAPPSWLPLTNNVPGNGNVVQITDSAAASQPSRYYRVRQLP